MTDRYAVVGNPVAHSRSPSIHAQFAQQTGQDLEYGRLLAPLDAFAPTVRAFRAGGGRGLNVTVPFKLEALEFADAVSPRARLAGAVNTLAFRDDGVFGDNTDGVGLVRDLRDNLGLCLEGLRVLLLGAGGASRGVLLPLLEAGAAEIVIANRTLSRAQDLVRLLGDAGQAARVSACGLEALPASCDLIINATSASLAQEPIALSAATVSRCALAYDMLYAAEPTVFLRDAQALGARGVSDGLGMLVEQAAESFFVWRGIRPRTGPVLEALRREISGR